MNDIQDFAAILIALAAGVLAGVALGYYTAATDLAAEKRKAHEAGFRQGVEAAWDGMGTTARQFASLHVRPIPTNVSALYDQATEILPDEEQEHHGQAR